MTLYDMTEAAHQLYDLLNAGEIDEQTVTDTIEGMMVKEKLEGYCQVIRQFEADAAAYEAEKKRFEAKQKEAESAVKRLESAVTRYMATTESDKMRCGLFEIRLTHSKAVHITNELEIPQEYYKPQPAKLSVSEIRKALLAGQPVAGAELQTNDNIKIK